MSQPNPTDAVPAELVMRLHRVSGAGVEVCKRYLSSLSEAERQRYVHIAETQGAKILHDPIEDDPVIGPLIKAVTREVELEVIEEHRRQIADLETRSPTVASLFRSGRGLCHRTWHLTKERLRERRSIDWRTPAEMNPFVIFD
jgi:hypothetical protein